MLTEQDIYDSDGKLLLAKNHETTGLIEEKLKKYDILSHGNNCDQCAKMIKSSIHSVQKKLCLTDTKLIDDSAAITCQVVFESKTKPWWLIINMLCNHLDWTYAHAINVSLISLIIASGLNYSDEAMYQIAAGSILHDAGKLLIPKTILNKKSELNDSEWLLIKQHCDLGASLTQELALPRPCIEIIQQHHERNDGSGYPLGLMENEINPYAKIVMVADVIDAITSYRPYRPGKQLPAALLEIKKGGLFSQEIISIFEDLITNTKPAIAQPNVAT
jgi:putative nucleotidyltransferase with HDIG domain